MARLFLALILAAGGATVATAQTMTLSTSNADFQVSNVFGNVDVFNFTIEIDAPLAPGRYNNPDIVSVIYQVMGSLVAGTPSGFPAFDLQRTITGAEFYAQGSSLNFEIAAAAVLTDGVQVAELTGNAVVFTFNGREIDNGRYHPALFELKSDGTGRILNSNNIHTLNPLVEVAFGDEYITDLMFDPGNTTLITGVQNVQPATASGGGGGAFFYGEVYLLSLLTISFAQRKRKRPARRLLRVS